MMGMPSAQNAASAASTARVWYKPVKSGSSRSSSSSFERRGGGGGGAAPGFAEGAFGDAVAARATIAPRRAIEAAEGAVCGAGPTGKNEGKSVGVRGGSRRRRRRTRRDGCVARVSFARSRDAPVSNAFEVYASSMSILSWSRCRTRKIPWLDKPRCYWATVARRRDGCEDAACRENGREGATHLQRGAESRPRARRQRDGAHAARGERRESRRRGACDAPLGCANGSHRGTRGARNRGRSVRFEGRLRSLRRSTDRNALGSVCRKARDAPDSAAWRVLRGAMRRSVLSDNSA